MRPFPSLPALDTMIKINKPWINLKMLEDLGCSMLKFKGASGTWGSGLSSSRICRQKRRSEFDAFQVHSQFWTPTPHQNFTKTCLLFDFPRKSWENGPETPQFSKSALRKCQENRFSEVFLGGGWGSEFGG